MRFVWTFAVMTQLCCHVAAAEGFQSSVNPETLREQKITQQGKYLTSREAFGILNDQPNILFIDVRDPVEVRLFGHPTPIDAIVPVKAQSTVFDEGLMEWSLRDNPLFLEHMEEVMQHFGKSRDDMIIITCGSGWRSAIATRQLHAAGYTDVWHVTDGYPGEEKRGINLFNAWKREGLPWSYERVFGSDRLHVIK